MNQRVGRSLGSQVTRRRFLQGSAAAGIGLAAFAAGCGSGQESSGPDDTPAGVRLNGIDYYQNAPDFTAPPQRGGKVVSMYNGEPPHLDPTQTTSITTQAAITPVYNRLVRSAYFNEVDDFDPWTFYPTGDLAESWEITPDGLEYIFKLRPGVKWQNLPPVNGRAFTAEDVVFSLSRFQSGGVLASAFSALDSISAPDPQTVRIRLKRPTPDFLVSPLSRNQCVILPRELADADGDFKKRAIGTGPFILSQYEKGVKVAFKRNPDYWRKDSAGQQLPYLDEYEFLTGDLNAQQTGFLSGQVDLTYHGLLGQDEVDGILRTRPDAIVYHWLEDVNTYDMAMQLKNPPFNDPRVRRAISMAVNWDAVNEIVLRGQGDNTLMFMPWSFVLDEKPSREDLGPWLQYNPTEAKQLLQGAGYGDGLKISFEYYPYQSYFTRKYELIQQQLREVGIDLELKQLEYTTYSEKWTKRNYTSMIQGFISNSVISMDGWTYDALHSASPANLWNASDPEMDRLVERQRSELDPEARRALWKQIWDRELDQVYRIPMTQPRFWFYAQAAVHNAQAPSRYHSYWHFGGEQSELWWRG